MQDILDIYEEVFQTNSDLAQSLVEIHIQKIKQMDEFLPQSLSFFILTDTSRNSFPFVSKNFVPNMGLDPEMMKEHGPNYWFQYFHPDDLEVWVKLLQDLMTFTLTEVDPEDRLRLSYTWNFRVKTVKGNYVNLFEHEIPYLLDNDGKPVVGVGHLTIVGDGEPMPIKGSVKRLNDKGEYETLYIKSFSQKLLSGGLTNRELDIVRLLALNFSSKKIGDSLSISSHTVDTHRRNILKKLNLSSTGELVGYMKMHQLY